MFSRLKNLLKSGKLPSGKTPPQAPSHDNEPASAIHQDPAGPKTPSGNAPQKKTAKPRYTKKGIPVFAKDEDMGKFFVDEAEIQVPDILNDFPRTDAATPEEKTKVPRRNKHGFPVLDAASDLGQLMMDRAELQDDTADSKHISPGDQSRKRKVLRDKHGIPLLRPDDSLVSSEDVGDDTRFEDLLLESLGNKSLDVLLHEKKDEIKKTKKLTLKQRLKAYPLPQSQLDLHGYTALKAELRTESYLKSAFYGDTHTVIIIVGKGLHSEEGAVLPDVVERQLIHLKKEKLVLAYEWDNKKKSRSGAVTVYLNNLIFSSGSR